MGSTDPATAIIPFDLGTAAAFDRTIFPLAYYEDSNNLSKGTLLIKATLDEMEKMKEIGIELLNRNDDFIFNTRVKVEDLTVQKAKLQDNRKTLNPWKAFLNYRAARLFHAASKALYLQTKRTSEKIHREDELTRVVPSTQMRMFDGAVSPDTVIGGISIDLPNGFNNDVKQTIDGAKRMMTQATTNPFQDNFIVSQLREDEQAMSLLSQDACGTSVDVANRTSVASSNLQQSRPSSPKTITVNIIQNSVLTTNSSNVSGITQNRGDRSSGASVTQGFAP